MASSAGADDVTRRLPPVFSFNAPFVVTLSIEPPPGTAVVGLEDGPPMGWTVSDIGEGGTFDSQTGRVKWGPFFDPSVPETVSYRVAAPSHSPAVPCFSGAASFDGVDRPVVGDSCFTQRVPAVADGAVVICVLVLIGCGSSTLMRRRDGGARVDITTSVN